jgi:putative transposase
MWRWSSASAHLAQKDDLLVKTEPLCSLVQKSWREFLAFDVPEPEIDLLRKHERTGRPLGDDSFIEKLERLLDRRLRPEKPGPKKKDR